MTGSASERRDGFAIRIIEWQKNFGRHELPWQSKDAYHVWLSEIMLQQTQVATVIPYYQRFVLSFPNIHALSSATEEQVLALWSGLGYYSRGRNLLRTAKLVTEKFGGEFPCDQERLLELPGIGRSTAAAICALAFHQCKPILDGNVKRFLARYYGIRGSPSLGSVEKLLWQKAEALLPEKDIAIYIQAQMDIGATICTRNKPKCDSCPVNDECVAFLKDCVGELPTLRQRKEKPEKHVSFLVLLHENEILLEKRPSIGIWGGLFCMPQFESRAAMIEWCMQHGIHTDDIADESAKTVSSTSLMDHFNTLPTFSHSFTHFNLHISPEVVRIKKKPLRIEHAGKVWLDTEQAQLAAIPSPVRNLLNKISYQS